MRRTALEFRSAEAAERYSSGEALGAPPASVLVGGVADRVADMLGAILDRIADAFDLRDQ